MYTVCWCTLCSDLASSSTSFQFYADQELCREVTTQTTLRCENSTVSGSPKLRTAERTRKEKLRFLDETPSFRPKIIQQVPDFSRLHRALQTEALRKTQSKETIKCQPFHLRTSALPERKSRMNPENSQVNVVLTRCFVYYENLFKRFNSFCSCCSFSMQDRFNLVWFEFSALIMLYAFHLYNSNSSEVVTLVGSVWKYTLKKISHE